MCHLCAGTKLNCPLHFNALPCDRILRETPRLTPCSLSAQAGDVVQAESSDE